LKNNKKFEISDLLISEIAKREIASIYRCDLSLIISIYEIELLKEVFKIDESLLYYLPFLLEKIGEKEIKNLKPFDKRQHFVTIGNFLHAPNVDAVLYLKKSIWSLIRKQLPKDEIHIYGAYVTQQILELHNEKEGFLIKGFVKDAQKVVGNAKVCLAPLRFGAGIKGKLTEAMQNGTPSVTSTIGVEGMHADLPWNGFIEDTSEKFAEKAVELYSNKSVWEKSQQNGIKIINQIYDKEKLSVPFLKHIKNLQINIRLHRAQNFIGAMLQRHTLQSTKYLSKWIEEKGKNSK
jgi:glycosyltransferase involved in cell wall biosynthesis